MMKFVIVLFLCLLTLQVGKKEAGVTLVTGLWLGKDQQQSGGLENVEALSHFDVLLETDENMIIFGEMELMTRVNEKRSSANTVFVIKSLSQLMELPSSKMVTTFLQSQKLNNQQQSSHLPLTPEQASILYSKMPLLSEALLYDSFSSSYLYWIDPSIPKNPEYNKLQCFNKQRNILRKFSQQFQLPFIVRTANLSSVHPAFQELQKQPEVKTLAVVDWFGGRVETIATVARAYENLVRGALMQGDYYSLEALFSMMVSRWPKLVTQINNVIPAGVYRFQITNFIPRHLQQTRHMRLLESNSSLRFLDKPQAPIPLIHPTPRYSESFYEYELLIQNMQSRLFRCQAFLCLLLLCVLGTRVSWWLYH